MRLNVAFEQQIASHESWANTADRTARTQPGRDGLTAKFEAQVDPDGLLSPDELARRVESARKAHFARLAFLSAKTRRANKAGSGAGGARDE